ncbi:MAG: transposase [Gammaproteobacteria bacterium]|nr:transposase [Gammaproteobacteria bacterium]
MKRLQAFKFELRLTGTHVRQLYRIAGSCRFVYNKALALQKERYDCGEKKLTYAGLCKQLTLWRNNPEWVWLKVSPSQALQQALKDLERAYQHFFAKRADFPRFKRRGVRDAFRFPQGVKLDQANSRVYLPKLGWVRYRNSRQVEGEISQVTISRSCDKWYVSIQTERDVAVSFHPSTTSVGVDVGIARLATLSDGTVFEAVNSFKSHQQRLAAYQRAVSRKKKFGQNWKKAIGKVSRLHKKIRHIRQDYLHQTSNIISKNHAMVCLEDLQIKNMSKSAAGTSDLPGRQVKAKSGLNKAILDQGWYELKRQLDYKQWWRGGTVVFVSPRNTSRTCPHCGYIASENRLTQSRFACTQCQYENNADLVGAINILRAGHAQLACGEMVRLGHSMNQEPPEVAQSLVARAR